MLSGKSPCAASERINRSARPGLQRYAIPIDCDGARLQLLLFERTDGGRRLDAGHEAIRVDESLIAAFDRQ